MKGGSTRQAGKGLGNPPPSAPHSRGATPYGAEGGPCCPSLGGLRPDPQQPPPCRAGVQQRGAAGCRVLQGRFVGCAKPPPLVPRVPASLPCPCCAGAGPGEAAGWLQAGRKGNGREFKRRVFNLEQPRSPSLPLASPLSAVSTIPKTHGFTPWPPQGLPLLWGSLIHLLRGTLGSRYPLVP